MKVGINNNNIIIIIVANNNKNSWNCIVVAYSFQNGTLYGWMETLYIQFWSTMFDFVTKSLKITYDNYNSTKINEKLISNFFAIIL